MPNLCIPLLLPLLGLIYLLPANAQVEAPDCPEHSPTRDKSLFAIGRASDLDDSSFLYCEYYFRSSQHSQRIIEYRDNAGQLFAQKTLDTGIHPLSPSVQQNDFRHGEVREVLINQDSNPPTMTLQYQAPNSPEMKTAKLDWAPSTVIDAGFHDAVLEFWHELMEGKPVAIEFISPIHLRSIALRIKKEKQSNCMQNTQSQLVCFRVEPRNTLLRWFVSALVLVYDAYSQKLQRFEGIVNITSADGNSLKARIDYSYY